MVAPPAASLRDLDALAETLGAIAAEAGLLLAAIPERSRGLQTKPDGSPATDADLASEALILRRLAEHCPGVPVLAEESVASALPCGERFFLVDPLDGTRDYLTGRGEYSVNVALVEGGRPVAAALAGPSDGRVWVAGSRTLVRPLDGSGGWRPAFVRALPADGAVALGSRRHGDPDTQSCLDRLPVATCRTVSSALKFGLIASGEADLYVRCGPTMEWDTAAGDLVLSRAGGSVVGPDGAPLRYGRTAQRYRNGPFAACGDPALAARVVLPGTCCEVRVPAAP